MDDKIIAAGEVWFVNFPLEEDPNKFLRRPVVVLNVEKLEVLSVKVTKTEPREVDPFDIPIVYWQQANLRFKSTARISKTQSLPKTMFIHKIGALYDDDFKQIQEMFMKFVSQ